MSYQHTKGGYIIIFHTILFVTISVILLIGVVGPIVSNYAAAKSAMSSKKAFLLANSATEEAMYRLKNSKNIGATQSITLTSGTAMITVANTTSGKRITVNADTNEYERNTVVNLTLGEGIAFHYGIQSGAGGFALENSSSITGNVFAAGPITGNGNIIRGDAISSGANGLLNGINATGTVYSHAIQNSTIGKDAYYITKTNTTVAGTSYPNSPDQPIADLPISDEQIAIWEGLASDGGTMTSSQCDSYASSSNTCTITSSKSLGPIKIPFNLIIKSSSAVFTVTGPIWVVGNITTQTGPTIRMDSSFGATNVAVIADNPADRSRSGIIDVGQTTVFQNSGTSGSFVFMISQNNSAETGGSVSAINMGQGASALVAYASHGLITLSQSVSVKEATAYKIRLTQSANVIYDTGLPNVLFSAGPGGGYNLVDWTEI
ncbi:MAG: hypothetical protein M3Q80_01630 [bacterium]|nr:hypothetical protein [bacterium]